MPHRWIYPARSWRVYDGDTLTVTLDLGFRVSMEITGRLDGIDTPEVRGKARDAGLVSRDWLRDRLDAAMEVKIATRAQSERLQGKYGRWLVTVWCDRENMNERLVEEGLSTLARY